MSENEKNISNRERLERLKNRIVRESMQNSAKSEAPFKESVEEEQSDAIAIIGMHGFLPGSNGLDDFWNIVDGDKSVIDAPPQERFAWAYDDNAMLMNDIDSKLFHGGYIPDIKSFDPFYFGILPKDAGVIDPQQRLLLMSVLNCFHNAGYSKSEVSNSNTGVYIAIEENEYLHCLRHYDVPLGTNVLNHHPSMAANRLSYYFNLKGPSQIVNTMCASGAYAMHNACRAILAGEVDQAVVGGARVLQNPSSYSALARLRVLSASGRVNSFGEAANGYIRSEGVASIFLKSLRKAQADGDRVIAVIKNTAVNYNGSAASIAYPDVLRHKELVKQCYAGAGVDPTDISYIEAQGMGNPSADAVEWEAFNQALQELCSEKALSYKPGFCAVSTLKPQIGHMECVSAFGALFRIIRSFQTNTIHRIHGLESINHQLDTAERPCQLLTEDRVWEKSGHVRYAGLHSYGSGGNNAHIIIEEYQQPVNSQVRKSLPDADLNLVPCDYSTIEENTNTKLSSQSGEKKRICVVGAGPSGLVMAKSLLESGHEPVVFEKQPTPGGLWNLKTPGTIGAYKSTEFQSSRYTSVFSDFCPEEFDMPFFEIGDVHAYLQQYADHFELRPCIQHGTEVLAVEEKGELWQVTIRKNNQLITEVFDGVALCQGSFWDPYIPYIKGSECFTGETIHSATYFDNEKFKGKRVLVIGNGVSAMDIAEEAGDVASEVYWSRRSKKLILPRMVGFVPNDFQSPAQLLVENNRINIIQRLKHSMPDYFEKYQSTGLLPTQAEFEANPIVHINDRVIDQVIAGRVTPVGDIAEFAETGCHTKEGEVLENIDVVVYCTGYENFGRSDKRFNYLKDISVRDEFSLGIFYHKNPTLVNTSVLPIAFTGSFYFMEMVARWYAQMLLGKCQLTDEEREARITAEHYLIMGPISNVIFGLKMGLFPDPNVNFKSFWKLMNYPAFPMIYRLQGAHSDPEARQKLDEMIKRSYVKTDSHDPELTLLKYRILAGLGESCIENLLKQGEITSEDYEGAKANYAQAIQLNWDSSYIKGAPSSSGSESSKPEAALYKTLKEVLSTTVGLPAGTPVDMDKSLSEYGLDSITLTGFAEEIVAKYPFLKLDASVFLRYPSLSSIGAHLLDRYHADFQQGVNDKSAPETEHKLQVVSVSSQQVKESIQKPTIDTLQIECFQKGQEGRTPLFLFHATFGTVQCYRKLINSLDEGQPVYCILSEGIRNPINPHSNMQSIAQNYVELINSVTPNGDVILGGYSQGGVIAYEVARQLQICGRSVDRLIMIDSPYPPIISYMSPQIQKALILGNILQLNNIIPHNNALFEGVELMPDDDALLVYLAGLGISYGLKINNEEIVQLIRQYNEVCEKNTEIMSNYIVRPLPHPDQLEVDYFARGHREQFFNEAVFDFASLQKMNHYYLESNCVNRWKLLLDGLNLTEVDATDHFSIIDDNAMLEAIADILKEQEIDEDIELKEACEV